jgi:hypothetical protein
MANLKAITAYIQDVEYVGEDITISDSSPYNNVIILLLKEKSTQDLYTAILTPEMVQQLAGLSQDLNPREMKVFADRLSERKLPIRIVVEPEKDQITAEMLQMSEEDLLLINKDEEEQAQQTQKILERFKFNNNRSDSNV